MEELVSALENENCSIEFYLNRFNALSDAEIVSLFKNNNIDNTVKDKLFVIASERINNLSTPNFIRVSTWASDVNVYKKLYFKRVEEMTYEEFVDLMNNGIYEPDILIEVVKTNIYKNYLEQEKKEQKRVDLQCCDIQMRLNLSSNIIEDLNTIGMEIMNLEMENISQNNSEKTENLEYVVENYLNTVIENIEDIELECKSIKICYALMSLQMKRHKVLTNKMIEFYLHTRVKELNLKTVCKNVIVTLGKSDEFGHYTLERDIQKGGTLKIYSEYLKTKFEKYKKEFTEDGTNDVINLYYLICLSHECLHSLKMKKFKPLMEKLDVLQWFEEIVSNKELNYFYRNKMLSNSVGDEKYTSNHRIFIEETQADLFAIFDSNRQLLTNFKDSFPKNIVENFVSSNADDIVSFYTDENGNMLSPIEKFDAFYLENIGEKAMPIVNDDNFDIMSSLMMGDKIPLDVFEFIKKIANHEIKTIDLFETLTTYIQNRTNLSTNSLEDITSEVQGPTL